MGDVVNLRAKLASFSERWTPKVVAELNGQMVKVAKLEGEYSWHQHETEDELFLVVHGELELRLEDRTVTLREGELFVVPRGVRHQPVAREECHVVLFEPATVRSAGDTDDPRGVAPDELERI